MFDTEDILWQQFCTDAVHASAYTKALDDAVTALKDVSFDVDLNDSEYSLSSSLSIMILARCLWCISIRASRSVSNYCASDLQGA